LNKAELVTRVSRDTGLTKVDVQRVLDAVLENVVRSLRKSEKVTLVDFGTFLVSRRRARPGHNPHSHEPMRIAARRWPRFAAGKALREAVRVLPERRPKAPPKRPAPVADAVAAVDAAPAAAVVAAARRRSPKPPEGTGSA